MSKQVGKTAILCSGVALGVYIPGVSINVQLRQRGYDTEVFTMETFLLKEKQDGILETKFAFHRNFKLALMGQKMASDITPVLDQDKITQLLEAWHLQGVSNFIVFSGFWVPIISRYLQDYNVAKPLVDLCHIDSEKSPSWKAIKEELPHCHSIQFFSHEDNCISYYVDVAQRPAMPFAYREKRFIIHGGGWGMGNYKQKISALVGAGIALDVMVYEALDLENEHTPGVEYYMVDPQWKAWEKNTSGHHVFPPFAKINHGQQPLFRSNEAYPDMFDITSHNIGIISKPGGSTINDSFASATPMIMLAPFGGHESNNSLLWQRLGFAISYENWEASNFSPDLIETLHHNLISARGTADNFVDYFERQLLDK